jgi:SAM-dependent methyltransferase
MNEFHDDYQEAEVHRAVLEPLWTQPLFRAFDVDGFAEGVESLLIAESRCGYVPEQLVGSMSPGTRIMTLESSRAMLEQARQRIEDITDRRVFYTAQAVTGLSYADGVFDGTVCLDGLATIRLLRLGLSELARVTSMGGKVVIGVPLAGAFGSVYDLFDEALRANQLSDVVERMYLLRQELIGYSHLLDTATEFGLHDLQIREVGWEVSFASGRDLTTSPLLGSLFMSYWLGTLRAEDRQPVLDRIEEAVDVYWKDSSFTTTVRAACLTGRR